MHACMHICTSSHIGTQFTHMCAIYVHAHKYLFVCMLYAWLICMYMYLNTYGICVLHVGTCLFVCDACSLSIHGDKMQSLWEPDTETCSKGHEDASCLPGAAPETPEWPAVAPHICLSGLLGSRAVRLQTWVPNPGSQKDIELRAAGQGTELGPVRGEEAVTVRERQVGFRCGGPCGGSQSLAV